LVSAAPEALGNFETPFGEFNGLKREGEGIVMREFPSLTHSILQMTQYDDNFVEESLELKFDHSAGSRSGNDNEDEAGLLDRAKRRINRRDAAKAAVDALLDEKLVDETVQVWTDTRG
jgi:hypothetical protein